MRQAARLVLAAIFFAGGAAHLLKPEAYRPIMPPLLPAPDALIAISGLAELAGAAGLLHPRWRGAAGAGLIVLLVAIFPANLEMLHVYRGRGVSGWAEALLWLRLPLQGVLIWWTLRVSRPAGRQVMP